MTSTQAITGQSALSATNERNLELVRKISHLHPDFYALHLDPPKGTQPVYVGSLWQLKWLTQGKYDEVGDRFYGYHDTYIDIDPSKRVIEKKSYRLATYHAAINRFVPELLGKLVRQGYTINHGVITWGINHPEESSTYEHRALVSFGREFQLKEETFVPEIRAHNLSRSKRDQLLALEHLIE